MTKKYENPPPKTSKPVKHLAGKKLEDGSKPERRSHSTSPKLGAKASAFFV